ncbi:MAG: hypothetical protein Q7S97_14340 [Polaromonas sp.]|nr:hypothetical protein [Polaromonas sp.]
MRWLSTKPVGNFSKNETSQVDQLTAAKVGHALIATHNLADYAGSEIFTLELATALREMGWEVLVAALLPGEPMASEFRKQGFRIVDMLTEASAISNAKFDLAWIHHTPVFQELLLAQKIEATTVIFCSLSHFEPLEAVPSNREHLDLLLAHSVENRNFITKELGLEEDQVIVFPNAVPNVYWDCSKDIHPHLLMRLAIISNHPPVEVLRMAEILQGNGVEVIHIGTGGNQILMSPSLLLNWDAVITIGKTVPYCFSLKVPVYCYDHFGGPGWLNEDNFELASQNNFSGRGFAKKTPEVIAKEIVNGYQESLPRLEAFRTHAANCHNLGKNLQLLLSRPRISAPKQAALADDIQTSKQHAQYIRLAKTLRVREAELSARDKEISRVKSTLSWRLTAPFRVAYNFLLRTIGGR